MESHHSGRPHTDALYDDGITPPPVHSLQQHHTAECAFSPPISQECWLFVFTKSLGLVPSTSAVTATTSTTPSSYDEFSASCLAFHSAWVSSKCLSSTSPLPWSRSPATTSSRMPWRHQTSHHLAACRDFSLTWTTSEERRVGKECRL